MADEVTTTEETGEDKVQEIAFDDLGLTKPLDKMTAKELRELVIEKLPMIVGASGMSKEELVSRIKEVFGIEEEAAGPADETRAQIGATKQQIRSLKADKKAASSRKEREILRRKIGRLKKQTRRLARSAS